MLWTWLASRTLFLLTGALGAHLLSHAPTGYPAEPAGILTYWAHWDGAWYSSIARVGYYGTLWPSSANFFPLYPLLLRFGLHVGLSPALAGVLISLAASLFALYFAYELARSYFGREAAQAATLALAFFPTAFFLNAVYTESLFLATALGSVWAARNRGDFVLAGVLGCFAATTRNIGVFLLLPLVHEWLRRRREPGAPGRLAALTLVPLGLAGYMFWLWRESSHPLLFSTVARRTWGRTPTNPLHTLERAWDAARFGAASAIHPARVFEASSADPSYNAMGTFDFVFLILLVALLVLVLIRLPLGLSAYAVGAVLVPVLTPPQVLPLASISRYALAVFPAFFVLGLVLARSRLLLAAWLAVSSSLGVLLTLYFTTWRWVA